MDKQLSIMVDMFCWCVWLTDCSLRGAHIVTVSTVSMIEKRVSSNRKLYGDEILLNFSKMVLIRYDVRYMDVNWLTAFSSWWICRRLPNLCSLEPQKWTTVDIFNLLIFINFITCYKELRIFQVVGLIESVQQNVPVSYSTPIYIY